MAIRGGHGYGTEGTYSNASQRRPRPRAVLLRNGNVAVVGGKQNGFSDSILMTVEILDLGTGTWSSFKSFDSGSSPPTMSIEASSHRIFVVGRRGPSGGASRQLAYVIDPDLKETSGIHLMPMPKAGAFALDLGEFVAVIGGAAGDNGRDAAFSPTTLLLDKAANEWLTLDPMPIPTYSVAVAMLSPTKMLIIGGWNGLNTAPEFFASVQQVEFR